MRQNGAEQYLMNIVGTAIQAGNGKLVTCRHVVEAILDQGANGYILSRIMRDGTIAYVPYPIVKALRYVDPRTDAVNGEVDLSVLLVPAKSTEHAPYETPTVSWGDSSGLGVGESILVCGYPHGTEMFKFTQSNRDIIQPTFYQGIVSAILPATKPFETRIIQISIPSAGGMSGGAVFNPETGKVMGMITSCVHMNGIPQPMSYAIPSEIIAPYVEVITFETK
ncbi:MAG: trypsin-like peptidase domain-containing protein, partial [Deltaproteobacteria bacterium]|nr:trypsin-like peptidase domain-containing protein [Deltaproteobacteria bacterium]